MPGGGGAPEIASLCGQTYIIMSQTRRTFVERVDFITSFGYGTGGDHRQRLGIHTLGPTLVVTDLGLLRPDPETKELVVTSIHQGVKREDIVQRTGWMIRFADTLEQTPPPTENELAVLRDLHARTERAHTGKATSHAGTD
jgi:glutaconate CoA-transferase, subunit B